MAIGRQLGRKLALYLNAAAATRSGNLRGCPLLPKSRYSPSCRGSYNSFLLWIKQLGLGTPSHVLDVGANHGDFSRAVSACYARAQIWLFEPLPALWPALEILAEHYKPLWRVQPFALGANAAQLPFYVAQNDDDCIGSLVGFSDEYRRYNPTGEFSRSINIRVERLDDFCAQNDIQSIDLLKIDVEGFEFEVLAGGSQMLQNTTALIVEVSLIRRAGGSPDALGQMISLLIGCGFHLVDLIPSLFSPEEPWKPLEYNLLARRPR